MWALREAHGASILSALLVTCVCLASCTTKRPVEPGPAGPSGPPRAATAAAPEMQGLFSDQLESDKGAAATAAAGHAPEAPGAGIGEELPAQIDDTAQAAATAPSAGRAPAPTAPAPGPPAAPVTGTGPGVAAPVPPIAVAPPSGAAPGQPGLAQPPPIEPYFPGSTREISKAVAAQEDLHRRAPDDPETTKKLIVLYLLANREEDALKLLVGGLRLRHEELIDLVREIIHDQVGDEREAIRLLDLHWTSLRRGQPLALTTAAFCSSAQGFGRYVPVQVREFRPGQPVNVYCELDNFECRRLETRGFRVSLHVDFDVLIPGPEERTVPLPEEDRYVREQEWVTERPLHDLWFGLRLRLPQNLIPGPYVLRIVARDLQADKRAEARLPFRIR